jgi:hypothetical protein
MNDKEGHGQLIASTKRKLTSSMNYNVSVERWSKKKKKKRWIKLHKDGKAVQLLITDFFSVKKKY